MKNATKKEEVTRNRQWLHAKNFYHNVASTISRTHFNCTITEGKAEKKTCSRRECRKHKWSNSDNVL